MNKPSRKPPIIRKGQKNPFRKATNEEMEERTEFLARALVMRPNITKTEIHRLMNEKFNIQWRMIDIYIARSKKYLRDRAAMSKDQARSFGVNVLIQALSEAKGSQKATIERRLGEIFGYDAPRHVQLSTPVGQPIETKDVTEGRPLKELSNERLSEIAAWAANTEGRN